MTMPTRISATRLKSMLGESREFALLDVREAGEFGESHLLFATPLPYSRLELDIGALVPRLTAPIVLCDDGSSGIATAAAARLSQLGYTDVATLDGGTRGWAAAGYTLFAGVNVPSKTFGELVEHAYHTPRVSVQDVQRMKAAGEDFVILDGRPWAEYRKMSIPGGICCPNSELPYRAHAIVNNPKTKIIVNCAGRTRSILGAQTLINFGIENPVYALENGTQGWVLADYDLEYGADRKYPEKIDEARLPSLQQSAARLMQRFGVTTVNAATVAAWFNEQDRTTYVLDVRTPEEFEAGSLPGARHAQGGQLIQATDMWIGVRHARIVLADTENVRAPVVASWLTQLGCEVYVLEGGINSGLVVPPAPAFDSPSLSTITAGELNQGMMSGAAIAVDLSPSMSFRKAHIPGSMWSIRPRLPADVAGRRGTIVLVSDDEPMARIAALELTGTGKRDVRLLAGGSGAWRKAGLPVEASSDAPPDERCIDYLFFVHDRHAGNRAAMRQYLAWETGLLAQLDDADRATFHMGNA